MKNSSAVIMAATVVMVVSLVMVLGLVLVLLAELYCSIYLRRRGGRLQTTIAAAAATVATNPFASETGSQSTSPLSGFYSQGVLQAPTDLLFPSLQISPKNSNHQEITEIHHSKLNQESNSSTIIGGGAVDLPDSIVEIQVQSVIPTTIINDKPVENLVYISNPIFNSSDSRSRPDTPFETPETSPSRLETGGSSSGEDDEEIRGGGGGNGGVSPPRTPPLTPMKELPEKACSVTLRSLEVSGSDSNSNNGGSSSTSGSPRTSPSW